MLKEKNEALAIFSYGVGSFGEIIIKRVSKWVSI
jgi:hypothetical protein